MHKDHHSGSPLRPVYIQLDGSRLGCGRERIIGEMRVVGGTLATLT
jgi:hypothetical protein